MGDPQGTDVLVLYSYAENKGERLLEEAAEVEVEEVALQVQNALGNQGYEAHLGYIYGPQDIREKVADFAPKVVFNLCEALRGISSGEPDAARILDELGVKYTGSRWSTLATALNKSQAKEVLLSLGVPTPPFKVLRDGAGYDVDLQFPLIVKPVGEDGSLGIDRGSVVYNFPSLQARVKHIHWTYNQPALVETYIAGREFNVAILGTHTVLPVAEMDFSAFPSGVARICTYDAKWVKESPEYRGSVPICPAKIPGELDKLLKDTALAAYKALDLRDYGRVDMRLSHDGVPYVIDVNPNPSISMDSGLTRCAQAAGLNYEELILRILKGAMERN